MTIYYIKQDDTVWGCGDPECCGEYNEEIVESFLDCKDDNVDAEHLQSCNGGGPVLEWRKATPLEVIAFRAGGEDGYAKGWEYGEDQAQSRIIKLLKSNLKLAKANAGLSLDMARTESYLHGLEQSIELIKGETK